MAVFNWRFVMALFINFFADFGSGSEEFRKTNNCTCPGDILIYNCNVIGSGFTIWRGLAFDCPNMNGDSRILLRHSSFGASSGTMGTCNDGAIRGSSLGISSNSLNNYIYMSQLMINLTASSNVVGQTVECVYRNPAGMETTIGSTTIEIADPPPPPTNIQLVGVSPEQLVFNWTSESVNFNCSTLQYNIVSNCGTCPDTIGSAVTSITCSIDTSAVSDNSTLCSFSIQGVVCTNISGIFSTPLVVTLKVPRSPTLSSVIPHYKQTDSKLIGFDINFNEVETFMISHKVDGSALDYTISYTDSNTGDVCDTLTIPASSCMQGICTVPSINPLPCSETARDGNIDISISASNRLGRGPSSFITIGQTNKYTNITFESTNKVVCTFLGQQGSQSTLSCDLVYGPCQQQPTMIVRGTLSSPNTVDIDLPITVMTSEYCYVINAGNGTFSILIEGLIKPNVTAVTEPGDESQSNRGLNINAIAGVIVSVIVLIIGAPITIIVITIVIYKKWKIWTFNRDHQLEEEHLLAGHDGTHSDPQSIPVHISFDLEDRPRELMKVLKTFAMLQINFKNIKIGPCTSTTAQMDNTVETTPMLRNLPIGPCSATLEKRDDTLSVRKIYIECENDLTDKEKKDIEDPDLKIGIANTLHVCCAAETQDYIKDENDVETKRRSIKEILEHKSGALLSLLDVVYSVEACKHINITDIDIKKFQNGMEESAWVTITFLPELAEDWNERYKNKRYKCKSIVKLSKQEKTSPV